MGRIARAVTLQQLLSHTSGIPSDNQAFETSLNQSLTRDGNLDAPLGHERRKDGTLAPMLAGPNGDNPLVFHGGSNEKNLAYILLQPQQDFAMVLMTNVSGTPADEALKALAEELYRRFGPQPAATARRAPTPIP